LRKSQNDVGALSTKQKYVDFIWQKQVRFF
jgi:hypothetical protein